MEDALEVSYLRDNMVLSGFGNSEREDDGLEIIVVGSLARRFGGVVAGL